MSDRVQSVVDLNEQVLSMLAMLRNLLGEGTALSTSLTPQLGPVRVDPSALKEAILHVVADAHKSMPNGGSFYIETEHISLASEDAELGLAPGQYVCLTLSNTGIVITPEFSARHLQPDYSTGLFLAPVYAFAKRAGGTGTVRREPSQGTTVSLYLPTVTTEFHNHSGRFLSEEKWAAGPGGRTEHPSQPRAGGEAYSAGETEGGQSCVSRGVRRF